MTLYSVTGVGHTFASYMLDGTQLLDINITDLGLGGSGGDSNYRNSCVSPDGRIYFFPAAQMDVDPFSLWQTIDRALSGPWVAGVPVDDSAAWAALEAVSLNGRADTGVFTADGALNVVFRSLTGGDDFMLRFADPAVRDFSLVARWAPTAGTSPPQAGAFSDGVNVYVHRVADTAVRRVQPDGTVTVVMDASASSYKIGAPVVTPAGEILAVGLDSGTDVSAVLSCTPTAPTVLTTLVSWPHAGHPLLPYGIAGTGVLVGSNYFISSGFYGTVGRYSLKNQTISAWVATGVQAVLSALPATPQVLPPLRYYPRDDAVGGSPRTDRSSTSRQSSARQGFTNTYR